MCWGRGNPPATCRKQAFKAAWRSELPLLRACRELAPSSTIRLQARQASHKLGGRSCPLGALNIDTNHPAPLPVTTCCSCSTTHSCVRRRLASQRWRRCSLHFLLLPAQWRLVSASPRRSSVLRMRPFKTGTSYTLATDMWTLASQVETSTHHVVTAWWNCLPRSPNALHAALKSPPRTGGPQRALGLEDPLEALQQPYQATRQLWSSSSSP